MKKAFGDDENSPKIFLGGASGYVIAHIWVNFGAAFAGRCRVIIRGAQPAQVVDNFEAVAAVE